ncbi:hypothetical protein JG688_00002151 [Phytophthora aleatoria]|uniref:Tc1-like transposase DDE domain-containing protein n=1 Tax=Phytophthora aleatoria TaxID=2496075 RepID=A0A8J5J564_9STRA|nr:hypothetical protein JG688_00002151 [Phytophthora aleatoria]
MHVKERDVFRSVEELSRVNWSHQNLVILDEVSFDNRGMIRKRGCAMRGEKVAVRAYCPFFDPIEFMFGYMKKAFQHQYNESSARELTPFVVETLQRLESFNIARVFEP